MFCKFPSIMHKIPLHLKNLQCKTNVSEILSSHISLIKKKHCYLIPWQTFIYIFNTIKYLELYVYNLFAKNAQWHKTNISEKNIGIKYRNIIN